MTIQEQETQLLGVNVYNWTQKAWDNEIKNPALKGMKKWHDLEVGFQRFLIEKTQDCITYEEVEKALKN